MSPSFSLRTSLIGLILVVTATGLAGCGEEGAQTLTFTLAGQGNGVKINGPQSADTGLARITLANESKSSGDLQLIRVEGDHSAEEVVEALNAATSGKAFPEWFFGGGGVGTTPGGERQTVTQVLKPGTYYAFDTEGGQGPPDPASVPALEVSGEESEETVEADDTISAFEYGFDAEDLPAGTTEVAFDNTGDEPHHLLAAPLTDDNTAADVERFFKTEKGKPPFSEEGTASTAVIEGGEGQVVTLELKPGRYALFCFISDRQGGPPHALKGMVDEVEVK